MHRLYSARSPYLRKPLGTPDSCMDSIMLKSNILILHRDLRLSGMVRLVFGVQAARSMPEHAAPRRDLFQMVSL